jgi:hypothetical protein
MADPGEIALRMLDPTWSTLHGTVRQWLHHGRMRTWLARNAEATGVHQGQAMIVGASGGDSPMPMPEETETVVRFWLERTGRSRYEFFAEDGRIRHTIIDDLRSILMVPEHGDIVRTERNQPQSHGVWSGDPRVLVGNVQLRFGTEEVVAGRPAVRVETVPVPGEREMFPSHIPVVRGILAGQGGNASVDAASGLVLRYESRDGDGRPMSRHEFVAVGIDEPVPDEVFTYDIPPDRRERTPVERELELLEEHGVDTSGIDPEDPAAVRRALVERFRSTRLEQPAWAHGGPFPRARRPLAEIVDPLGPPPQDVDAAKAQIADALTALGPDGQPKAGRIERGEVLDAAGPERIHPLIRGKTVTTELLDVVFLRDDEAVVDVIVHVSGGLDVPFKGRVVCRDGCWLLSYDTVAYLRQMGGEQVPSLLDDPDA